MGGKKTQFYFKDLVQPFANYSGAHISWHNCIYSPFLRPNHWNSHEKILRIGELKNSVFFWVGHFDLKKKITFFALSQWKSVKIYRLAWMELNFDYYSGFQLKIIHAN